MRCRPSARSGRASRRQRAIPDRGAALLLVLISTALLSLVGLGLVLLGDAETMAGWNARASGEALYAAEAMADRVVQDLTALPDWSLALDGTVLSSFVGSLSPTTDYGESLNLSALTAEVQAQTPAVASWGTNTPIWRLFAHGSLSAINGPGTARSVAFLAAWVADDGAEIDDDPEVDVNGVVSVLAQARGPGGARRSIRVVIARVCSGQAQIPVSGPGASVPPACGAGLGPIVRVLSWREV
jgi:hypothetical protein